MSIRRQLMHVENELGSVGLAAGDYAAAYASFNGAVEAAQDLAAAETANSGAPSADTKMILAQSNQLLGKALYDSGSVASAVEKFQKAKEIYTQMLSAEPGNLTVKSGLDAVTLAITRATAPPRRPYPQELPARTLPSYDGLNLGVSGAPNASPPNANGAATAPSPPQGSASSPSGASTPAPTVPGESGGARPAQPVSPPPSPAVSQSPPQTSGQP